MVVVVHLGKVILEVQQLHQLQDLQVEVEAQEAWEVQEVNPQPFMYLMVMEAQELFLLSQVPQFNMRVEVEVARLLPLYLARLLWVAVQVRETAAITQRLLQVILLAQVVYQTLVLAEAAAEDNLALQIAPLAQAVQVLVIPAAAADPATRRLKLQFQCTRRVTKQVLVHLLCRIR
jgi:hypothetical protein